MHKAANCIRPQANTKTDGSDAKLLSRYTSCSSPKK